MSLRRALLGIIGRRRRPAAADAPRVALRLALSGRLRPSGLGPHHLAAGASPTKQVVLVLDQAGWHTSYEVVVPEHVHLLFLPSHAPELQPCEHLWQFTDAPLLNRHFRDLDELEDVQVARCAVLQERRALIRSATLFSW